MQAGQDLWKHQHRFRVWAPLKEEMTLQVVAPFVQEYAMKKESFGYFSMTVETAAQPLRYFFKLADYEIFPDPGSHFQPEGVHGPSQTVDHTLYRWNDASWKGMPLEEMVIYELHVGTFTPEGTFEAIIPRLDDLLETGINTLELMPVAQFPGNRNWGYDGVFPYAVQDTYGGPDGLKKLVDACHQKGIAVLLDAVYNHLGPEGACHAQFGPYFTGSYRTPWGEAINFDGEWSDGVREYFSHNVLHWLENYHLDGLRCDAIHAVFDNGAVHFWELVHTKVKQLEKKLGKRFHLIAESDLNSPKVIQPPARGGYGFAAQWLDDFHHALYVLINPKDKERYYDFGSVTQLAKAYKEGFVHSGEWVKFRKRKHGRSSAGIAGSRFVAFNMNHDQAGNRAGGERLCMLVNFERVKLAAAALLLSPYIPLLFMGEEYADKSPFFYFVSHSDADLIEAVRKGRKDEFKDFGFAKDIPDPQAPETFLRSKINWENRDEGLHRIILQWHRELLTLRKTKPALKNFEKSGTDFEVINAEAFLLTRKTGDEKERLVCFFNLSEKETLLTLSPWMVGGKKLLDSNEPQWRAGKENNLSYPESLNAPKLLRLLPLSVVIYEC